MNHLATSAMANVSARIGALELSDLQATVNDGALESAIQMGPNGPTSLLANCYATKSALCPRIDNGEPLAHA